jgi:hypothetical protein
MRIFSVSVLLVVVSTLLVLTATATVTVTQCHAASTTAAAQRRGRSTDSLSASESLQLDDADADAATADDAPEDTRLDKTVYNDDASGTAVILENGNDVREKADESWRMKAARKFSQKLANQLQRRENEQVRRTAEDDDARKAGLNNDERRELESLSRLQRRAELRREKVVRATRKAQGKAGKRKKKNKKNKKPHRGPDLTDLCAFSKTNKCPKRWENRAFAGVLVTKRDREQNPFRRGGDFNRGWAWSHPYLCCAKSRRAKIDGLYFFAKSCPRRAAAFGVSGALFLRRNYNKQPFLAGGGFNDGWKWTHPTICQADDASELSQTNQNRSCLLGRKCPQGTFDAGYSGIIISNETYKTQPFAKGGKFNKGWKWAHPKLCCLPE